MTKLQARIVLGTLLLAGIVCLAVFSPMALFAIGITIGCFAGCFGFAYLIGTAFGVGE